MDDRKHAHNEVFGYFEFGMMDIEGHMYVMKRLIETIKAAEKLGINIVYEHRKVDNEIRESVLVFASETHENTIDIRTNLACASFSVDYLKDKIDQIKRKLEIRDVNMGLEERLLEAMG